MLSSEDTRPPIKNYELAVGGRASRSTILSKAANHKFLIMKRFDGIVGVSQNGSQQKLSEVNLPAADGR